jgi:hypothetical protein
MRDRQLRLPVNEVLLQVLGERTEPACGGMQTGRVQQQVKRLRVLGEHDKPSL